MAKPLPGTHGIERAVAAAVLLRDLLRVADNVREVKAVLAQRQMLVDGKAVKRRNSPVGFMDVVSLPAAGEFYRVLVDRKARATLLKISESDAGFKLCKITGKRVAPKGRTQLALHDGRSVLADGAYATGDTLKLAVPGQKILAHYKLEKGARCLITRGRHAGETATLDEIYPATATRSAQARLSNGASFITVKDYLFVIGDMKVDAA
jgi:small subunit ribosomal protein S4e